VFAEWDRTRHLREVTGPWLAFERELSASLTAELHDEDGAHLLDHAGKRWMFVASGDALMGTPLRFRGEPVDAAWALVRVRVSVEVLDGVL
jgi:hypothetical protein